MKLSSDLFKTFSYSEQLTPAMLEQFNLYYQELVDWNTRMNLTAMTQEYEVIEYHFRDSLALKKCYNFNDLNFIVDVGSGAGFPAIPLKICFPHLSVVLIEVNQKKVSFLKHIINILALKNIEICAMDWRTFLRTTSYAAQLFCARASLSVEELLRMFKPVSPYANETLVYWAASNWQPTAVQQQYIVQETIYQVGNKKRKLVIFKK